MNAERRRPERTQVYLDSSDFSGIADQKVAPEVVEKLVSLRAAGKIDLRFSVVHVAEAAPIAETYLSSGQSRLRCIQRLCWPHALSAHSDLLELEGKQLRTGTIIDAEVFHDDGNWFPKDVSDIALTSREELLRDVIKGRSATRTQRRALKRLYFTSAGQLTARGSSAIIESEQALVDAIAAEYPINAAAKDAIHGYVRGTVSGAVAIQSVIASARDLTVLSEWLENQWSSVSRMTAWLHETGAKQEQSWKVMATSLRDSATRFTESGMDEKSFWDIGALALKRVEATAIVRLASGMVGDDVAAFTPQAVANADYLAPSISLMSALIFQLARATYSGSDDARAPKKSDFGDLSHCVYIPYVDFFRTDGFMADMIKKAAPTGA
jgi:hypothetical protein